MKKEKLTKKSKFVGIVISEFKVRGKVYKEGDEYDAKTRDSYEYLKDNHKIK